MMDNPNADSSRVSRDRREVPSHPPGNVDVGVGVGRNIAVDAVNTEFMFLLDDDHVVTPNLNLDKLIDRFSKLDIDILGVRQGPAAGRRCSRR
jgi:hypothetical protein